jgi:hypothetical protein
MKPQRMATMLILLCMLRLPAWPQDQDKGHQVVTKLQIFFSELETQAAGTNAGCGGELWFSKMGEELKNQQHPDRSSVAGTLRRQVAFRCM